MKDLIDILKQKGAILDGHFLLTSGRHSDKYIEKFRIIEDPEILDLISTRISNAFIDESIDIVMSAAIGGILLCGAVGRVLNRKHIFTERVNGSMKLRRGFNIPNGSNVLIVEDIVTTGGSIFEIIEVAEKFNANIVGIGSIIDRNKTLIDFGYNYKPLVQYPVSSWSNEEIPDWLNRIPISKPGRSGKK
tara:strand:- start:95 stop:664 length:570 start_codon:yes stop_codon:yes gene_type:complete